jgi:hypothetical protein
MILNFQSDFKRGSDMYTHAPNFKIESGVPATGYPLPRISHFASREIQVQTSEGRKHATEVTIYGENFIIRAITPEVLVNGHPLVSYRIADDFQSITGYFFGGITQPAHIVVDYGLGVRGEFTGWGDVTISTHRNILVFLLLALFFLLLLAVLILVMEMAEISWLAWISLGGAIALSFVALLWSWFSGTGP